MAPFGESDPSFDAEERLLNRARERYKRWHRTRHWVLRLVNAVWRNRIDRELTHLNSYWIDADVEPNTRRSFDELDSDIQQKLDHVLELRALEQREANALPPLKPQTSDTSPFVAMLEQSFWRPKRQHKSAGLTLHRQGKEIQILQRARAERMLERLHTLRTREGGSLYAELRARLTTLNELPGRQLNIVNGVAADFVIHDPFPEERRFLTRFIAEIEAAGVGAGGQAERDVQTVNWFNEEITKAKAQKERDRVQEAAPQRPVQPERAQAERSSRRQAIKAYFEAKIDALRAKGNLDGVALARQQMQRELDELRAEGDEG